MSECLLGCLGYVVGVPKKGFEADVKLGDEGKSDKRLDLAVLFCLRVIKLGYYLIFPGLSL